MDMPPTHSKFYTKQMEFRHPPEIKITHQICMNKLKKIEGIEYPPKFRIEQIAK